MKKATDIADGEQLIPKHFQLTPALWQHLREEALQKTGGNISWVLRNILREYYRDKENH